MPTADTVDATDAEAAVGDIAIDDDVDDEIMADIELHPFTRILDIIGIEPSTIVASFLGLQTLTLKEYHIRMFLILLSADYQMRGNFAESLYDGNEMCREIVALFDQYRNDWFQVIQNHDDLKGFIPSRHTIGFAQSTFGQSATWALSNNESDAFWELDEVEWPIIQGAGVAIDPLCDEDLVRRPLSVFRKRKIEEHECRMFMMKKWNLDLWTFHEFIGLND